MNVVLMDLCVCVNVRACVRVCCVCICVFVVPSESKCFGINSPTLPGMPCQRAHNSLHQVANSQMLGRPQELKKAADECYAHTTCFCRYSLCRAIIIAEMKLQACQGIIQAGVRIFKDHSER